MLRQCRGPVSRGARVVPGDDRRHKGGCNSQTGTDEEGHVVNQEMADQKGAEHCKDGGHSHAPVEGGLGLASVEEPYGQDAKHRSSKAGRLEEHREEEHGASVLGDQRESNDHSSHDIVGERLEQICASAGTIAYVVTDEIGDNSRVAWVVLRDICLDLADEIGSDVGCLGIDASTDLGKEGCETGTKSKADEGVWILEQQIEHRQHDKTAVSYTHLTLP